MIRLAVLLLGLLALAPPAAAQPREPWQLEWGPFVTAADVREHSRAALDWRDLRGLVDRSDPDWPAALQLYAVGRHFKNHSLAIVADDYNGRLGRVLPRSTRHFGTPSFQALRWGAALMRTSRFRAASDPERVAFLKGAAPALMINWSRYELGEADRKAKAEPANWALTNGAPKNWNEIFAFYVGPDGKDSVLEALASMEAGRAASQHLLEALARGQEALVRQSWPAEAASSVREALDRASLLLLAQALAEDGEPALAAQRAAGAWLAAAEAVLADPDATKAVEAALTGKPERPALAAALRAVEGLMRR